MPKVSSTALAAAETHPYVLGPLPQKLLALRTKGGDAVLRVDRYMDHPFRLCALESLRATTGTICKILEAARERGTFEIKNLTQGIAELLEQAQEFMICGALVEDVMLERRLRGQEFRPISMRMSHRVERIPRQTLLDLPTMSVSARNDLATQISKRCALKVRGRIVEQRRKQFCQAFDIFVQLLTDLDAMSGAKDRDLQDPKSPAGRAAASMLASLQQHFPQPQTPALSPQVHVEGGRIRLRLWVDDELADLGTRAAGVEEDIRALTARITP